MSTFVLHHPDVVVMEMDKTGRMRVFVGFETDTRRNVYEFTGRIEGRLDDLPPRLRTHWQPNPNTVSEEMIEDTEGFQAWWAQRHDINPTKETP